MKMMLEQPATPIQLAGSGFHPQSAAWSIDFDVILTNTFAAEYCLISFYDGIVGVNGRFFINYDESGSDVVFTLHATPGIGGGDTPVAHTIAKALIVGKKAHFKCGKYAGDDIFLEITTDKGVKYAGSDTLPSAAGWDFFENAYFGAVVGAGTLCPTGTIIGNVKGGGAHLAAIDWEYATDENGDRVTKKGSNVNEIQVVNGDGNYYWADGGDPPYYTIYSIESINTKGARGAHRSQRRR